LLNLISNIPEFFPRFDPGTDGMDGGKVIKIQRVQRNIYNIDKSYSYKNLAF
jgi:hypothetical protein